MPFHLDEDRDPASLFRVSRSASTSSRRRRRAEQLGLDLRSARQRRNWGGKRNNSGRKPANGKKAGVPHRVRPALASRYPVHVTLKVAEGLPNLRSPEVYRAIERALFVEQALEAERALERARRERLGGHFRVVHFCVQKDHLHLLIEAASAATLSRGMQGLSIRLARGINRALGRKGRVFADRFHARILRTPREVRSCLQYILNNTRRHRRTAVFHRRWTDPCSSAHYFDGWRGERWRPPDDEPWPVSPPHTWLIRVGWRRHGLLELDTRPGPR
jgi:REP element-mobilizing transposase RayT